MKTAILALAISIGLPTAVLAQAYPPQTPDAAAPQDQLDHLHDHLEHDRQHQQIEDAHDREHASGFTSDAQHQEYHQQLEGLHGDVHDTLPGTEHAHNTPGYNSQAGGYPQREYQGGRGYNDGYAQRRTTVTHYSVRGPVRHLHHHHTTTHSRTSH